MRRLLFSLALLATLGFAGCGGESDGKFDEDAFPFTFEYPDGWEEIDDPEANTSLGSEAVASHAVGLDDANLIAVQNYSLNLAIDEGNIDQAKKEFDGLIQQLTPEAEATIGDVNGYPSLEYEGIPAGQKDGYKSNFTAFFIGDQEYLVNCQYDEENRDEVLAACDQTFDTLEPK